MSIRHHTLSLGLLLLLVLGNPTTWAQLTGSKADKVKPNILWITCEDTGQELGCYGDSYATTPNLDKLASRGMKFAHAWSCAPVCAPARTTIVTGVYPTTLGAQHMRSAVRLPEYVKLYPQMLRDHGYYCSNNVKTDYNLQVNEKKIWDDTSNKAHWRNRKKDQPFFAVFNFTISHESQIRTRPHTAVHDPAKVKLPAYHPDTPEVRQDWAQYYDQVTKMDQQAGEILRQLEDDGLADNTIIFFYGDHGSGMPRHKRWLYESGLRVPVIVHIPDRIRSLVQGDYEAGSTSQRLISFIDLVPTILSIAGIQPPEYLPGNAFLGSHIKQPSNYLFGFRDRMDERYDMSRSVRDERFSYIRNFMPHRPQGTYLEYMFQTPTTVAWKKLFDEGKLDTAQSSFWKNKPAEELYDLQNDPAQIHNLAGKTEFKDVQDRLSQQLHAWMLKSNDLGLLPEGEMWSRAGSLPPMELAKDAQQFPVEKILNVAELASAAKPGDLEVLLRSKVDPDSACRYWVAQGVLIRAIQDQARQQCVAAARGMSNDSSPYVRCLANETLARFGTVAEQESAVKSLLRIADIRSEGFFPGLVAFNSLDWCPITKSVIGSSFDGIPEMPNEMHQRYKTYIPRMIERINSQAK